MGIGGPGVPPRRRAQVLDRRLVGAGLNGRDSGKVEGVDMIWPDGQKQAVEA